MKEVAFGFLRLNRRSEKPRKVGLFVGSDASLTSTYLDEFLEVNHQIVDIAKTMDKVGLVTRFPAEWIKRKNRIYEKYGIDRFIGGIAFELAYLQNKSREYFQRCVDLEYTAVEISEDVIPNMPLQERASLIGQANEMGLKVYTEIGKKSPTEPLTVEEAVESINFDIKAGADKVTIEISELKMLEDKPEVLKAIVKSVGLDKIFFEVDDRQGGSEMDKPFFLFLVKLLGPDINVENVAMRDCRTVEIIRQGMSRLVKHSFLTEKGARL